MFLYLQVLVFYVLYSFVGIRIVAYRMIYDKATLSPNITRLWLIFVFWPVYMLLETYKAYQVNGLGGKY